MSTGDGDLERVLRARAIAMAAPLPAPTASDAMELVVFRAGAGRYAIDALEVAEAIELGAVTPLPGLPPFYRGLIVHEGVVYPLIDIRPLVGGSSDEDLAPAHAILFSSSTHTIAVAAESVESFVRFESAAIGEPSSYGERASAAIRGVTADGIVLLDVHVLLGDARLVIDDRA